MFEFRSFYGILIITMKKKTEIVKETGSRYFTEEDVVKIIEDILPSVLTKRPELRKKLRLLIDGDYVTREEILAMLEEMKKMREDMNKRFEEMREDMNRRFEAVNRRFEAVDRRFEDMNRRFEAVDRRFEEMRVDFKEAIATTIKALSTKMDTIGSRWGIMAEGSFRATLHEIISGLGFTATKWKEMDDGKFFLFPREVEIDILIKDGRTIALEVKSSLTISEVEGFERAVRFYEEKEKKKVDEKIILAIYAYPGVKEYASRMGIKIISEPEEIK